MAGEQAPAAASARIPADPSGSALAGLLDVLDQADGGSVRQRPRAGRSATHRPAAATASPARPGGPARCRRPARRPTAWRPAAPAPGPRPAPAAHRRPHRRPGPRPAPTPVAPRPRPPPRSGVCAALVQRLASWGAGPGGAHRSWGSGAPVYPSRARTVVRTDAPVVLRELPSTPHHGPGAARLPLDPRDDAGAASAAGPERQQGPGHS